MAIKAEKYWGIKKEIQHMKDQDTKIKEFFFTYVKMNNSPSGPFK